MKNLLVSIFSLSMTLSLMAQKPTLGPMAGERVPLYCGSTGSSSGDTTRLPILFQAKIMGLTPGASYKYFARFISLADTASSTTTGAGIPISINKKTGAWKAITSPSLSTSGGHDTIVTGVGGGEYSGWFGAMYTNDAIFTPGKYVYPMIVLEEISSGSSTVKMYITDSIKVLGFANNMNSNSGTAIYGSSFVKSKAIVLLYDQANGLTNRPISITYAENEGTTMANTPSWYSSKVNATNGAWGTIIPNNFSNGITRIESRDFAFDTIISAHMENDATWGNDSTINQKGGATKPIVIKSDYAPLVKPEFEFVTNTTNVNEANTVVNMLVRRRYGNADTSKISAFVVAGTATDKVDFEIMTPFPVVFRPYGEVIDTIKVKIMDDFSSESTENAAIRLTSPVNARVGVQTTHSINIVDNDIPMIVFDKKTVTVKEDNGVLKVKLRITSGSTTPTSVKVVVKKATDSTSIPAEFKIGTSNRDTTVQFAGGKVIDSLEFNIPIIDDKFSEDRSDTIILALRTPTSPAKIGTDSLFTLIIEDNDAPPIYRFSRSSMTIKENTGSIKLRVNRTPGNKSQSDIIVTYDPDPKNALPGTDYTFSTKLVQLVYTDPDSVVFTVPILDDKISESREDAVFIIRSSFNAKIGKPDTLRVTILDDDLPEYKIGKVTTTKSPNMTLDSLNVKCALRGVVYGGNMGPAGSTPGISFTLVDNTGGIQVSNATSTKGYTVTEGDSIQIYGVIGQVNGMAQLNKIDTILVLGSGRALKTPMVGGVLDETTESQLVKYTLVKLKNPAKWPSTAMAANTTVMLKVQSQSDSFDIVIDSETDIDGKAAPTGFFHVTGIGAQNDNTSPYTSNYYLVPRRFSDFQTLTVPVFGFATDSSKSVENRDSTEPFILQCANLTSAQQINIVIKGGNAIRGTDYQSNANRLFILSPAQPTAVVKTKLNDDVLIEGVTPETIVWVIRDNAWGTLIGPDSIHVVQIIDNESVGIELVKLTAKTKVYPNPSPANSEVVVSTEAIIGSIAIVDLNGKVVREFASINASEAKLNIEGLAKGIYTVSIMTDKGKIVKQLSVL